MNSARSTSLYSRMESRLKNPDELKKFQADCRQSLENKDAIRVFNEYPDLVTKKQLSQFCVTLKKITGIPEFAAKTSQLKAAGQVEEKLTIFTRRIADVLTKDAMDDEFKLTEIEKQNLISWIRNIILVGCKELLNSKVQVRDDFLKLFGWEDQSPKVKLELVERLLCSHLTTVNEQISLVVGQELANLGQEKCAVICTFIISNSKSLVKTIVYEELSYIYQRATEFIDSVDQKDSRGLSAIAVKMGKNFSTAQSRGRRGIFSFWLDVLGLCLERKEREIFTHVFDALLHNFKIESDLREMVTDDIEKLQSFHLEFVIINGENALRALTSRIYQCFVATSLRSRQAVLSFWLGFIGICAERNENKIFLSAWNAVQLNFDHVKDVQSLSSEDREKFQSYKVLEKRLDLDRKKSTPRSTTSSTFRQLKIVSPRPVLEMKALPKSVEQESPPDSPLATDVQSPLVAAAVVASSPLHVAEVKAPIVKSSSAPVDTVKQHVIEGSLASGDEKAKAALSVQVEALSPKSLDLAEEDGVVVPLEEAEPDEILEDGESYDVVNTYVTDKYVAASASIFSREYWRRPVAPAIDSPPSASPAQAARV